MMKYGGAASRSRAAEKQKTFLTYLIRYEVTDRLVVADLLSLKKSATYQFVADMIDHGLVAELNLGNLPYPLLHLTPKGLALAHQLIDHGSDLLKLNVQTQPSRIALKDPAHALLTQHTESMLRRKHPLSSFRSEREINQLGLAPHSELVGTKVPDLLWLAPGNKGNLLRVGVEMQLTLENTDRRERVMSVYGHLIGDRKLYGVMYVSPNAALLHHYMKTLYASPRPHHRLHLATTPAGKKIFDYVVVDPGIANPPVTAWMLEKKRFMFEQLSNPKLESYLCSRRPRKSASRVARKAATLNKNGA